MIRTTRSFSLFWNLGCAAALFFLLLLLSLFAASPVSAAETESYEVQRYALRYEVHKDHSYDVSKVLTVNIPEDMSALTFSIASGNYRIEDLEVRDVSCEVHREERSQDITITSADALEAGEHSYEIRYRVREYADSNSNYDIFYLDALPPGWEMPIGAFSFTLVLPEDFVWDDLQYYAGQYSSQNVENKLSYTVNGDTLVMTGEKLPANFGITFKAELPEGYWEDPLDNTWTELASALLMAGVLVLLLLLWVLGGRDPRHPHVNTDRPIAGVSTADVGYLFNGRVTVRDTIPILAHLGALGCLRISEYKPKKYRLYKLQEPPAEEARYIRNVYTTLFEGVYRGRKLEMEDLGLRLARVLHELEPSVASGYQAKDMRARTRLSAVLRQLSMLLLSLSVGAIPVLAALHEYEEPAYVLPLALAILSYGILRLLTHRYDMRLDLDKQQFRRSMAGLLVPYAVVLGYAAWQMWACSKNEAVTLAILAAGFAAIPLICWMTARASGNARLVAQILGLRDYMMNATRKELAAHQAEDAHYYDDMLPFALQFSLLEQWAEKFSQIPVQAPAWFSVDLAATATPDLLLRRTPSWYAREINQFARTVESEYDAMRRSHHFFGIRHRTSDTDRI